MAYMTRATLTCIGKALVTPTTVAMTQAVSSEAQWPMAHSVTS